MTQDQCLDNGHQAASSSHSANDKTSDDQNKSNNSIFESGINTAQEFNVDVNSKRIDQPSTDVLLVQNLALDTDRSSTDKVITKTENYLGLTSDFVDSTDKFDSNAKDHKLTTKMTVITHQSSDENIREIISHPDELNKIPNDSQVNIESNIINEINYNKKNSKDKNTPRGKSDLSNTNENDKPEDPIERLNKLRASISSALSEVKGVLKQYSTEQSIDGEPESTPASRPADDGPVRFRFVRKIRRRSVFSEDIEDVIAQKNIIAEETALAKSSQHESPVEPCSAKETLEDKNKDSLLPNVKSEKSSSVESAVVNVPVNAGDKKVKGIKPIVSEENVNEGGLSKTESMKNDLGNDINNSNGLVSKKIKLTNESGNLSTTHKSPSDAIKTTKSKKGIKKDRRSSVTLDNTSSQLNLKAQRRPSDSGTIVKHPIKIKSKTSVKSKSIDQVNSKVKPNNKAESSTANDLQVTNKQETEVEKVDAIQNDSKFPKGYAASKYNNGVAIQDNTTNESSDITQTMTNLNDTLEVKALLDPSKSKEMFIHEEKGMKADIVEIVPKSIEILTQNNQVNEICTSNSNSSAGESIQMSPKIIQFTDIFQDLKANIEGDLTFKIDKDTQPLNSINNETKTKDINATVMNKEPIPVVAKPLNNERLLREEEKANVEELSNSTEDKSETTDDNAMVLKDEPKAVIADLSNSIETKLETEGDNAIILKEELKSVVAEAPTKTKKKAKRKVVIRRIKRKLSKDDTFIQVQETPSELEIEEKEIEEKDANDTVEEEAEVAPKQRKSCIKARQFEIGDIVMYAERYKKTQVKWRKAKIIERITSISYKLDIDGEEKPAHISYIKKFTDRKVNFGGKEYLEIDYAQIEEDEEKERNYSIWNLA